MYNSQSMLGGGNAPSNDASGILHTERVQVGMHSSFDPSIEAQHLKNFGHGGLEYASARSLKHAGTLASTVCGPGCRPMFYCALLEQPSVFTWPSIIGINTCELRLSNVVSKETVWREIASGDRGFRWNLPNLGLNRQSIYQWSVHTDGNSENCDTAEDDFVNIAPANRIARIWLLSLEDRERFIDGIGMLRERSDNKFLPMAEALYLAEFQLYHHALIRLPLLRNRDSIAFETLYSTTRSIIFRQMALQMRQIKNLPHCFIEWAEQNDRYHRLQAEAGLPYESGDIAPLNNKKCTVRKRRIARPAKYLEQEKGKYTYK